MRKVLSAAIVLAIPSSALAEDARTFDLLCHIKIRETVRNERWENDTHIAIDLPGMKFCFKGPDGGCGYIYPVTANTPSTIEYYYDPKVEGPDHAAGFYRGDSSINYSSLGEHIVIHPGSWTYHGENTEVVGDLAGVRSHSFVHGDCKLAPFSGVNGEVYFSPFPSWKDPKNRPFHPTKDKP